MPKACLFVPYVGVYLAILSVLFLFAYFWRGLCDLKSDFPEPRLKRGLADLWMGG
jgi:hypothetical protein